VARDGVPKLLDFGIAKLLTADSTMPTVRTMAADRFMTPDYASPEQIRGESITTATDVYSLGLLLYELLTGCRPFHLAGLRPTECERLVCMVEPAKPSTIGENRRELAGDLDSIILKALRKEPSRRYGSVELLAEDIRRHLDGLPVEARPDTWRYRAGKFVRRHRLAMSAALAMLLILVSAIILTTAAQRRAEAANAQAERHFQNMLAMANSSLFEIHDAIVGLPGSTEARALVVRRALGYLDLLTKDHNRDPALRRELASAYERLSDIQYRDGPGNLGDSAGALASAQQALRLRRELAAAAPQDTAAQRLVASDLSRAGEVERLARNLDAAVRDYSEALAILETLARGAPQDLQVRVDLADAHLNLGLVLRIKGDLAGASAHFLNAPAMRERLLAENPTAPGARRGVEQVYMTLSNLEIEDKSDIPRALSYIQRALAIARGLVAESPQNRGYQTDLASVLSIAGHVYARTPEPRNALPYYRESLSTVESLAANDPGDARARRSVAIHSTNIALVLDKLHDYAAAEPLYRRSVLVMAALLASDPQNNLYRDDLAYMRSYLGLLLVHTGRTAEGTEQLQQSIAMREALLVSSPDNIEFIYRLARSYEALATARELSREFPLACDTYRHARDLMQSLTGKRMIAEDLERLGRRMAACGH
jgi:tetratricopeptide (TPR) repeat protein